MSNVADTISCLEYQELPFVDRRAPGQFALGEAEVRRLEKIEGHLPKGFFEWRRRSIKFSQYCGVFQLGNLTIEVLPKIYGKEDSLGSSREALVRMLHKAKLLKVHKGGASQIDVQKHTLLDVFILHFCEALHAQLLQGKVRNYISREENLGVIKGRLLIEKQMKYNLSHKERLFCRYDELSEDIELNQVIKFTLSLLLARCISQAAKKQVYELLMRFDGISDVQVSKVMLEGIQFDRANSRYQPIFEQCVMFINSLSPDVVSGQSNLISLLFDMNRLFEAWLAACLRPVAWKQGLRLREQGPRKYMAYRPDLERDVFQMKPDISFLDENNKPVIIADAKWKILDSEEAKLGISQQDLYQMQAYANRYSVNRLVLFYPEQERLNKAHELIIKGVNKVKVSVLPVDLAKEYRRSHFLTNEEI